ncbi:MAG: hypothetical protein GC191_00055 [Azospirillum sp.]|nr:hypothetical protein [Azospirillum sp.]
MTDYQRCYGLGMAAMQGGRFDAAVDWFLKAIRADPRPADAWLGVGMSLARQGRIDSLLEFIEMREGLTGEGFELFHRTLAALATDRHHDALLAVWRGTPRQRLIHIPALYYAAAVMLARDDDRTAFALFADFRRLAEQHLAELPVDATNMFNIPFRQAFLVEDLPYVEALEATAEPQLPKLTLPEFALPEPRPPAQGDAAGGAGRPWVLVAACDGQYCRRFAAGLVASFEQHCRGRLLHLHVADSDAGTDALLAELQAGMRANRLAISREISGVWRKGAYYASNRFLIADRLMDFYGADLLISDVDIRWTDGAAVDRIIHATATLDFACFRADSLGPSSRCDAIVTWFAGTPRTRRLLALVRRFVAAKIDLPEDRIWMLDQAALYSVLRVAQRWRDPIRAGFINQITGQPRSSFVTQQAGIDEKAAMIRAVGGDQGPTADRAPDTGRAD